MRRDGVVIAVVGLLAAACGSSHHAPATSTTSSTPTVTSTVTTTQSNASSTSKATHTSARGPMPPAGGPVPKGFRAADFTAISAQYFWLLGTAPCPHPVCTSIVRTNNGGAHFVGIPAPPAPLGTQEPADISQLRFANTLDGYAAGPGFPQGGAIWTTHNGGATWQRSLIGPVLAFDASGDMAYAVTGVCTSGSCHGVALLRNHAGSATWSATPVPLSAASARMSLTAHGQSVWVSLSPASGRSPNQSLVHSSDGGQHLAVEPSPCQRDLGGRVAAVSPAGLWAVCPTGMEAGLWRSTTGGAHWTAAAPSDGGTPLANSALIAPVNTTTAVIAPGDGELLLTTDGGRIRNRVMGRPGSGQWAFIGFTDPSTGSGLFGAGPDSTQLWRTSDGGVHWHGPVPIR